MQLQSYHIYCLCNPHLWKTNRAQCDMIYLMRLKEHLRHKQSELIRALGTQDYSYQEIANIFGVSKSYVFKIISTTSKEWVCPWVKRNDI